MKIVQTLRVLATYSPVSLYLAVPILAITAPEMLWLYLVILLIAQPKITITIDDASL